MPSSNEPTGPTEATTSENGDTTMAEPQTPDTNLIFSYEKGVDIQDPAKPDTWIPVRYASDLNPQVEVKEIDAATYDDKGADHMIKVGESTTLSFTVLAYALGTDGKYFPEVEILKAATEPDANGTKATVKVRYYDKPSGSRKPNPDDAYEITATVSMTRVNTGVADKEAFQFTLKAQGPRKKITNPYKPETA